MDPITLLIVCPLVFLAGLVDAIAGGGGLISLTAYLLAGLPAHNAIATNKLSSMLGTAIATMRLARKGYVKIKLAIPAVIAALAGSFIGAKIALLVPDNVFEVVMIVALPITAFFVLRKRTFANADGQSLSFTRKQFVLVAASAFVIGMYDGFYGPGTGTFMLIAFTAAAKLSVREASGVVKAANLASNVAGFVTFALAGTVWWALGLIAAVFSIAGNYVGAGMLMKDGTKVVRPIIIVVLCLLFIKVIVDLL